MHNSYFPRDQGFKKTLRYRENSHDKMISEGVDTDNCYSPFLYDGKEIVIKTSIPTAISMNLLYRPKSQKSLCDRYLKLC